VLFVRFRAPLPAITTGTINANGDLVVSNGGVWPGNSSHGIRRQADNSVEVLSGGSGDIRHIATGIGFGKYNLIEQSLSCRFSAYRAVNGLTLDTLNGRTRQSLSAFDNRYIARRNGTVHGTVDLTANTNSGMYSENTTGFSMSANGSRVCL
jgi:hypothetical protein